MWISHPREKRAYAVASEVPQDTRRMSMAIGDIRPLAWPAFCLYEGYPGLVLRSALALWLGQRRSPYRLDSGSVPDRTSVLCIRALILRSCREPQGHDKLRIRIRRSPCLVLALISHNNLKLAVRHLRAEACTYVQFVQVHKRCN